MGVRPHVDVESRLKAEETFNKQLARVYLIWLIGFGVGAIKVHVEKVEFGGLEYRIENSDALSGMIFFGCLLYYDAIFANVISVGIQNHLSTRGLGPRAFYDTWGLIR